MRPSWLKSLLFLFLVFFIAKNTYGQTPIKDTINTYVKVTSVNSTCNSVSITAAAGFNIGDKVLLIQMKGATVKGTNTVDFGVIDPVATGIGNAGNYEFNEIGDIQGTIIYFKYVLLRNYTPVGLQLISIPQYTDVNIVGTLTARAWNGNIGGVVVFEASGTVEFNADINVEGLGFRGGGVNPQTSATATNFCSFGLTTYYANLNADGYGGKGEGISEYITGRQAAQACQANAGGGGHSSNTGAGGGSNYGKGGKGGRQSAKRVPPTGCNSTDGAQGQAGLSLSSYYAADKIFLGGGGGGGQQNNFTTSPSGFGTGKPGATPGNPGGGCGQTWASL